MKTYTVEHFGAGSYGKSIVYRGLTKTEAIDELRKYYSEEKQAHCSDMRDETDGKCVATREWNKKRISWLK